jgi:hypothetical protein
MTSIVIYGLGLLQEKNRPKIESLIFIGFMIIFLFLIKMVYTQPLIILWILLLLKKFHITSGIRSYFLILFKVALSIFALISSLIVLLIALGFSINSSMHWLRGYLELALGYTTMMSEEPGRLWEYIAYPGIASLIFLFNFKRLNILTKLGYLLIIYQGFRYGFNRHHAHSNFSFLVLFTISLFVALTSNKLLNKVLVLLSAFSLVVASNLSVFDTVNVTGRAHNLGQLFKALDPRFRQTLNMQSENKLLASLNLPNELRELTISSSYTFIPWPYSVPDYMTTNYRNAPDPHLFGAWTDWLDEENYKWIQDSSRAPKYILSLGPNSVDSRNPFWDSPKFQLELICYYGNPKIFPNNWYLFERLISPRCDLEDAEVIAKTITRTEIALNSGYIQFLEIELPRNFIRSISSILFKPLFPIYAHVNGQQYRVVEKSTNFLFINGDFQGNQTFWTETEKISIRFPEGTRIVVKKMPISK